MLKFHFKRTQQYSFRYLTFNIYYIFFDNSKAFSSPNSLFVGLFSTTLVYRFNINLFKEVATGGEKGHRCPFCIRKDECFLFNHEADKKLNFLHSCIRLKLKGKKNKLRISYPIFVDF